LQFSDYLLLLFGGLCLTEVALYDLQILSELTVLSDLELELFNIVFNELFKG
jgi:hypothetical protein